MQSIFLCGFIYLYALPAFALSIQNPTGQTLKLPATNLTFVESFSDDASPSNQSFPSLNASEVGEYDIRCWGTTYGFNPDVEDCRNAINFISHNNREVTFAQRETGRAPNAFPLPFRLMGGM